MIIDQLENASAYFAVDSALAAGLRFLQSADVLTMAAGKYPIAGSEVYAIVQRYDTRPREAGRWEAHRQYFDIQYLEEGVEMIGYADVSHMTAGPYDAQKDLLPLEGQGAFFVIHPGTFVVLGPQDAHMPGIAVSAPQPVTKVVVKVRVSASADGPRRMPFPGPDGTPK